MPTCLASFLHSRHLAWRALRIAFFSALGGWLLIEAVAFARVSPLLLERQWPATDFTRSAVDLDEIRAGGPPKDGIPAIDAPRFIDIDSAGAWLDPREPVIVVSVADEARAYPLQILMYHEIVNDRLGELPLTVTFCPLCNASLVFDRRISGRVLDFGTTGLLRLSDLVMYDRQTESWWQQFTGRGIVGEMTGVELRQVPSQVVAFADFAAAHPEGRVLSRETGFSRAYGSNPYRGYDAVDNNPFLFEDPVDPRLPAMERVLAVETAGAHRLYPLSTLRVTPLVHDRLDTLPLVVFSRSGMLSALDAGQIAASRTIPAAAAFDRRVDGVTLDFVLDEGTIRDRQTGSSWDLFGRAVAGPHAGQRLLPLPGGVHFAFAWLAFHPDSEIYRDSAAGRR